MISINKILDRFILLYPCNEYISDLYKCYIEKKLYSAYKIINRHQQITKIHSLEERSFKLQRIIFNNDIDPLWDFLSEAVTTQFIPSLKYFNNNFDFSDDFFSRGQIKSKLWLIDQLKKLDLSLGTVFLCAGWYSILSVMMFENKLKVNKIRNFEIDPSCLEISEVFNKPWVIDNWKFKTSIMNIHDIDFNIHTYKVLKHDGTYTFLKDIPDTIINTSCEHIENFDKWYSNIPKNKLLILQSNNYIEIIDHINCVKNLHEFEKQTPMSNVLFNGELQLENYKRFMRIGYK